jgi:hypothetical protein
LRLRREVEPVVVQRHFSDVLIPVNLPFTEVPRPVTIEMMAREMPAAISPYSMDVAADWSVIK